MLPCPLSLKQVAESDVWHAVIWDSDGSLRSLDALFSFPPTLHISRFISSYTNIRPFSIQNAPLCGTLQVARSGGVRDGKNSGLETVCQAQKALKSRQWPIFCRYVSSVFVHRLSHDVLKCVAFMHSLFLLHNMTGWSFRVISQILVSISSNELGLMLRCCGHGLETNFWLAGNRLVIIGNSHKKIISVRLHQSVLKNSMARSAQYKFCKTKLIDKKRRTVCMDVRNLFLQPSISTEIGLGW